MKNIKNVFSNPALLYGIGLFPLIIICTALKTTMVYALLLFLTMILSYMIIGAFKLIIPKRVRFVCYTLVVLSVVYVLDSTICELFPKDYNVIHGLIVFLLAGSVIFYSLEESTKEESFKNGLKTTTIIGLNYALTMVLLGFVREILGNGSLWGNALSEKFSGLEFFTSFAGGLMIVIVIALIFNCIAIAMQKKANIYKELVSRYDAVITANHEQSLPESEPTSSEENVGGSV